MRQIYKTYKHPCDYFAITSDPDVDTYYLEWICGTIDPTKYFGENKSCICVKINPTVALMLITNFNPDLAYKIIITKLLKTKPVLFTPNPAIQSLAKFITTDIIPEITIDELGNDHVRYTITYHTPTSKLSLSKVSFYRSQIEGNIAQELKETFITTNSNKINNLDLRKRVKNLTLKDWKLKTLETLCHEITKGTSNVVLVGDYKFVRHNQCREDIVSTIINNRLVRSVTYFLTNPQELNKLINQIKGG